HTTRVHSGGRPQPMSALLLNGRSAAGRRGGSGRAGRRVEVSLRTPVTRHLPLDGERASESGHRERRGQRLWRFVLFSRLSVTAGMAAGDVDSERAARVWLLVTERAGAGPVSLAHVCDAAVAGVRVDGAGLTVMAGPTIREVVHATDPVAARL